MLVGVLVGFIDGVIVEPDTVGVFDPGKKVTLGCGVVAIGVYLGVLVGVCSAVNPGV